MPWRLQDKPTFGQRVICVLCYFTAGIAGILYIIFSGNKTSFFRFHFLQSIILGILAILLGWACHAFSFLGEPFFTMLDKLVPATGGMVANGFFVLINIVVTAFKLLPVYGAICAALGKFAEIPFISNVVRQQTRW